MLIIFVAFFNKNIKKTVLKIIGMLGFIVIGIISVRSFFSVEYSLAERFLSNLFLTLFAGDTYLYGTEVDISGKFDRIPIALNLFFDSPLYGYMVSPRYSYSVLMNTDDLPAILLHLIGGGILLTSIYLYMMIKIIYGTYREIQKRYPKKLNDLILYSTAAVFGGFCVTFFNTPSEHYLSMFIIFISIKVYKRLMLIKLTHK